MPWYGPPGSEVPSLRSIGLGLISHESKLEEAVASATNEVRVADVDDKTVVDPWICGMTPFSVLTSKNNKVCCN